MIIIRKKKLRIGFFLFYLYLLFFISLFGNIGYTTLNQVILWIVGPIVFLYYLPSILKIRQLIPKEIYAYFFLTVWAIISFIWCDDLELWFRYAKLMTSIIFLLFIMVPVMLLSNRYMKVYLFFWLACFSTVVYSLITSENVSLSTDTRISGLVGNANGLATWARMSILCGLMYLLVNKNKLFNYFLLASILIMAFAILISASRGNFANLVFIFLGYFYFVKSVSIKSKIGIFFSVVVGAIILYYFIVTILPQTFLLERLERSETVEQAVEGETRIKLYILSWELIKKNWLVGVGLNQFRLYSGGKISHADFADIWASLGLVGLLLYVKFNWEILKRILGIKLINNIKALQIKRMLIVIFISEFLFGLSSPNYLAIADMFLMVLIGLTAYRIRVSL